MPAARSSGRLGPHSCTEVGSACHAARISSTYDVCAPRANPACEGHTACVSRSTSCTGQAASTRFDKRAGFALPFTLFRCATIDVGSPGSAPGQLLWPSLMGRQGPAEAAGGQPLTSAEPRCGPAAGGLHPVQHPGEETSFLLPSPSPPTAFCEQQSSHIWGRNLLGTRAVFRPNRHAPQQNSDRRGDRGFLREFRQGIWHSRAWDTPQGRPMGQPPVRGQKGVEQLG